MLGLSSNGLSNYGAYYSSGGVFYPMQETRISIEKEILTFKCTEDKSSVNIYFEFLNPENESITSTIGFVAPFPGGDISEEDFRDKGIRNFRVQLESKMLPFDLKMADCPDCELRDTGEYEFSQWNGGVFVYLFEITFRPGINRVSHSYDFNASTSVEFDAQYDYTLSTGAKWAGSKIKDLTVEIEIEGDNYFYVSDMFGASSDWMVVGSGKVSNDKIKFENEARMVRIITGKLIIHVEEFKPESDFYFGILHRNSFCHYRLYYDSTDKKVIGAICSRKLSDEEEYSKSELRLIRNGIYAEYGYAFNSKALTDFFNQFGWYVADPNIALNDIRLSRTDNAFVHEVMGLEKLN
ncbi:MAG: hypothetical protein ACJASQ_003784 [Crocinitomicaceae bacterium]|jgi:hypothetical protein